MNADTHRTVLDEVLAFQAETDRLAAEWEVRHAQKGAEDRPESDVEAPTASPPDFVRVGLTYRQIDHWTRRGWLKPIGAQHPGSGYGRRWPMSELRIAALMRRLTDGGFEPWAAAWIARDYIEHPAEGVKVGEGLYLQIR